MERSRYHLWYRVSELVSHSQFTVKQRRNSGVNHHFVDNGRWKLFAKLSPQGKRSAEKDGRCSTFSHVFWSVIFKHSLWLVFNTVL